MEKFLNAYLECMLWCSSDLNDETDRSFESVGYGPDDIEPATMEAIKADCAAFLESAGDLVSQDNYIGSGNYLERAGHDFWLTRNRHGAGFWDGDWEKTAGKKLTDLSHPYGDFYLFVNEENKIQKA